MKRLSILGSTGSIGKNTLQVVRHLNKNGFRVQVMAIAAKSNIDLLEEQAIEFSPEIIAVYDDTQARLLQKRLPKMQVLAGLQGLEAVASHAGTDFVVSAMAGTLGLAPTMTAIQAGKTIGLANKEALVSGGELVTALAKKKNVTILPIDSEHNAIFQCLQGNKDLNELHRLVLTASGGPFRTYSNDQLSKITVDQALAHPTWHMGPKVTIDSSTLMNKGLEVIEAHWLFGVPIEQIEVVVHPQSIIHSMVEFKDSSMMAQLCAPSMLLPIQYAITYPKRLPGLIPKYDFIKHGNLQFFVPDTDKFRCLKLAYNAIKAGGSLPCYMNAANEVLVERFLNRQIAWIDIAQRLETLMERHSIKAINKLDDVQAVDKQARLDALK